MPRTPVPSTGPLSRLCSPLLVGSTFPHGRLQPCFNRGPAWVQGSRSAGGPAPERDGDRGGPGRGREQENRLFQEGEPSGAAAHPDVDRAERQRRRSHAGLQGGNILAGEQIQQLAKLRQLMMAQINAQNVYMAHLTNRYAQRAATQQEWVKNGNREAPVLPDDQRGVGRALRHWRATSGAQFRGSHRARHREVIREFHDSQRHRPGRPPVKPKKQDDIVQEGGRTENNWRCPVYARRSSTRPSARRIRSWPSLTKCASTPGITPLSCVRCRPASRAGSPLTFPTVSSGSFACPCTTSSPKWVRSQHRVVPTDSNAESPGPRGFSGGRSQERAQGDPVHAPLESLVGLLSP